MGDMISFKRHDLIHTERDKNVRSTSVYRTHPKLGCGPAVAGHPKLGCGPAMAGLSGARRSGLVHGHDVGDGVDMYTAIAFH